VEGARQATGADVGELERLAAGAAVEYGGLKGGDVWRRREARPEPYGPSFEAELADAEATVVVGTIDDVVVGYAAARVEVLRDGTRLGRISELFVEQPAREVAVGEVMMDLVLGWCREQRCSGVDALVLPGHREGKNFFERFGLTARAIVVHREL
jgi:GNAT superfamily N-acetyltransferase